MRPEPGHFDDSTPLFESEVRPAPDTPNVICIVLDDVGFAHLGCYGSDIETPAMDRLAAEGLRYNNFHTTAMCSPTRAALLTGRNHHVAGVGMITEFQNGFPGYRGSLSRSCGTIAEVLREQGFRTYAVGKWHLTPSQDTSAAGPFDRWPLGCGFDKYYGFLGASADQWHPHLVLGNEHVKPPERADYHLSEDLIDRSIGYIDDLSAADPGRPFFLYLAFGAVHAPFHAPKAAIDKYRSLFDDGWDAARARILQRQLDAGIVPPGTRLAPRNPGVRPWDELSADERTLYSRMQEVFAGYLDHTDAQIARLIASLEESGLRDNTMIVLLSDNGASQEGGLTGRSELHFFADADIPMKQLLSSMDGMGGEHEHSHYPQGWAQVGNTPLKRYKQNTYGGGIRDPLIISWPKGITARGDVRTQYHHVVDLAPTILDVVGAQAPDALGGIPQEPIQGVSMRYSFDDAEAPTCKKVQYYEMWGHRALWSDGWKAVAYHERGTPFDEDRWELYQVDQDFAELDDLAERHPAKLAELVDSWWQEAEDNRVLPLDDRMAGRRLSGLMRRRDELPETITLRRGASLPGLLAPGIPMVPRAVRAFVTHRPGDEGVLLALGGRFAGYTLYIKDGGLHFEFGYYMFERQHVTVAGLPAGRINLGFDYRPLDDRRGTVRLRVGDTVRADREIAVFPLLTHVEPLEIGEDNYTPVSPDYTCPFRYTGTIHQVSITGAKSSEQDAHGLASGFAQGQ